MDKDRAAEILSEIGTLLELKGENPFKTRAYENAARTLESLTEPLDKLIAENRLDQIKGIGEGIQKKIIELVTTGKLDAFADAFDLASAKASRRKSSNWSPPANWLTTTNSRPL